MKRIFKLSIAALLVLVLMSSFTGPAMSQDNGYIKVKTHFNVGPSDEGHKIPQGSIIRHLDNDITEVYGPDNLLVLKVKDSEAETEATPVGLAKASHIYEVPSGAFIKDMGNIVECYKDNVLILTVIDKTTKKTSPSSSTPLASLTSWIEYAHDSGLRVDYSAANWTVPNSPPNVNGSEIGYIFNGISPWDSSSIIQPVLEWNKYRTNHFWSGTAWYYKSNGQYWCGPGTNQVNVGDIVLGRMYWLTGTTWRVYFRDNTTGGSSQLDIATNFSPIDTFGLQVFWTLEGYYIQNNNDVPGHTNFANIDLRRNGSPVSYTFHKTVNSWAWPQLTNLDVTWSGQTNVTLHTANP